MKAETDGMVSQGRSLVGFRRSNRAYARRPQFDECADRRQMMFAHDVVSFLTAGFGAVLGQQRALVDSEHRLLELRPTPATALVSAPVIAARAQR